MHLGRRPSGLPAELETEHGIARADLDPRAAWRATVERALDLEVDALLLAGDVVDSSNQFMEAYGALLEGVRRLVEAGVDVVAVAGNHDVTTLPRLADELEGFTLLGRGGRWETHVVQRGSEPVVRVLGWSFPTRRVESSPLDGLPAAWREGRYEDGAPDELRTVGLLHCDLDASPSPYAPVASRALAEQSPMVSAWFLGHVHQPSIRGGGRPLGYLGSLVGLDFGERGARGPWFARSEPASWELDQLVLSPVLFDELEVAVDGCSSVEDLSAAVLRAIQERAATMASGFEGVRVVGLRPRLCGRTTLAAEEIRTTAAVLREQTRLSIEGVLYFVDKLRDDSLPAVDLEALAARDDPLALVARRLLDLQAGGAACEALVAAARPRFAEVAGHPNFQRLGAEPPDDATVRACLLRVAGRALDELLGQKASSEGPPRVEEIPV